MPAAEAGQVSGRALDLEGVGGAEADVGPGVVDAAEGLDLLAEPPHRSGSVAQRIGVDDGLPAAALDPGEHALVGHGPGQAQGVGHRFGLVAVGPDADAADRRPAVEVVEGDPGAQPRFAVHDRDQAAMAATLHQFVETHGKTGPRGPVL